MTDSGGYNNFGDALPLPPVYVVVPQKKQRSPRLRRRHRDNIYVANIMNRIVLALNSMHDPTRYRPMKYYTASNCTFDNLYNYGTLFTNYHTQHTSQRQQRLNAYIHYASVTWLKEYRRVQPQAERQCGIQSVDIDARQQHEYSQSTTVRAIVADRVALPDVASKKPILNLLPPEVCNMYLQPNSTVLKSPTHRDEKQHPPRLTGDRSEYVKLIHRMYRLGMVTFTDQPISLNGMFCVDKTDDTLRCIIDARNANTYFIDAPSVTLPTPTHMSALMFTSTPMYVCKMDLSNFYHQLALPDWMQPYFGLPPLTSKELPPDATPIATRTIYPCCTTLPMGFSHSVYIAQQIHQRVVYQSGLIDPRDNILHVTHPVVTTPVHLLYIDDNAAISNNRQQLQVYYDQCVQAYNSASLEIKLHKCTPPTDVPVEVLGVMMGGNTHIIRPSMLKLLRLQTMTIDLLRRQHVTGQQLSQLIGHWIWVTMLRRPALSMLFAVYHFIEQHWWTAYKLTPAVQNELYLLIAVLPLLYADCSRPFSDTLYATDASMHGMGITRTAMTQPMLNTIWPLTLRKSHDHTADPSVTLLYRSWANIRWTTIVSHPWRYNTERTHINELEMRAVLTMVRHIMSIPHSTDRRYLFCVDNTTTYYSLRKGRSSSYCLRSVMAKISATVLAGGLVLLPCWVPTDYNPADQASRT
jgi:hypothetical protein